MLDVKKTHIANSLVEFVSILEEIEKNPIFPKFFRGVSKDYPLLSSLGRYWETYKKRVIDEIDKDGILSLIKTYEASKEEYLKDTFLKYEKNIFETFKYYTEPEKVIQNSNYQNDWELLALGRHHGLETRLMDWTINPLVALFFAVKENFSDDGIVYCDVVVNTKVYNSQNKPTRKIFDLQESAYYVPSQITERARIQNGLFLVQKDPREAYNAPMLYKITIPSRKKVSLLKILDTYGINEKTLFPGLDGIAGYANLKIMGYEKAEIDQKFSKEKKAEK